MFSLLSITKRNLGRIVALLSVIWLAACEPIGLGGAGGGSGQRINLGKPVPVALLVPGGSSSAGDAILAKSLEKAARLAMADLQAVQIDLRVYDTKGDAGQAALVAKQAVDDGAKIILGPVFAQTANAAGVAVASRNVNVLSFSNNTRIAGGNVFVLGNTFQNTADRLVGYAKGQGLNKIMVVHSSNTAGLAGRDAISQAISNAGATAAGVASYEFSQQGVLNAVPKIASTARSSGAQAIFFTSDSAGALPLLTQMLPENRVDPKIIKFIGLTRWDIPATTLSLPGVQGGWFALADPNMTAKFRAHYTSAYGEDPHPIAGLAYDGIAAIGALVKAGKADALTTAALTQGSGFAGVSGIFRLRPNGTNQRGLAVAKIENNQVVLISPAPKSFGGAGF